MSKKPLGWLKTKARLALGSPVLVDIAGSANSPNSAYELAYIETGDAKMAQSCRFLAMAKRDHGKSGFELAVSSVNSNRPRQIGRDKSQGEKAMPKAATKQTPKQEKKETATGEKTATLPLRDIKFRAAVNGTFARVRCIQRFGNDAQNPVEAVYVFPLPDEASVTGCKMKIGKRTVEAELKEKAEARRQYDEAVAQGHHASLLEQERPNVFTMNVGGIEPGEEIFVEFDYVQRVPWMADGGRFTIPLVVAPRFIPGTPQGKQGSGWADDTDEVPDASRITPVVAREGVSYDAEASISFAPGFRANLTSPSHDSIVPEQIIGKDEEVEIKTGKLRTDRDLVFVYRSLSKAPEVARHAGSFGDEKFLIATIIPPAKAVATASDCILVLDCSYSMEGPSIDGLKVIAKKVIRSLREQGVGHRVGILPFDSAPRLAYLLGDPSEEAENFIDGLYARGGTEIGPALSAASRMFGDSNRPKVILLVGDGQSESGINWRGGGIRLIAAGISSAINDTHIKDLALGNQGTWEAIFPGEDYDAVANRLSGYLSGPVLRNVSVDGGEIVGVGDVFERRPATIAARFSKGVPAVFTVTGIDPNGKTLVWRIEAKGAKECDFASKVWAREFIREKPDKGTQVEVSLKYGVISKHTSFVAVSLKKVPGQKPERVEIPVNLPSGWDYEGVFGTATFSLAGMSGLGLFRRGRERYGIVLSRADSFALPLPVRGLDDADVFDPLVPLRPFGPLPDPSDPEPVILPPVIIPPSVSTPPASRFRLDTREPADKLVAILIALIHNNRSGAEVAWKALGLTPSIVKGWDVETRAMAYYFAVRLRKHGFKLDGRVWAELSSSRSFRGINARAWQSLAFREEGRPASVFMPDPTFEAHDYIVWKCGRGPRPLTGDWAIVP